MNPLDVLIGPTAGPEASVVGLEHLCQRLCQEAGMPSPSVRRVTTPEELFEDLEARLMGIDPVHGSDGHASEAAHSESKASPRALLFYDPMEASPAFEAAVWRWHAGQHGPRTALELGSDHLPWPPTERCVSRILEISLEGALHGLPGYFGSSPPLQAPVSPPHPLRLPSGLTRPPQPGPRGGDLSTIEAILNSPRQETSRGPAPAEGPLNGNGDRAAADSPPTGQRALGGRLAPERKGPGAGHRWPQAQPGTRPQTAFLRSPALGARPRETTGEITGGGPAPGRHDGMASSDGLGLLDQDPTAPLLSREEIDAFFAPPTDAGTQESPAGTHAGPAIGPDGWPPAGDLPGDAWDLDDEAAEHDLAMAVQEAQSAPPPWLKRQVADLADIVQALELVARSHQAHVPLSDELTRLRQFTKTVAYVASPPPRGSQEFDMATLAEEALGALAGTTPDAPRILFRRRGEGTITRADKELVASALDALLQTAIACSRSGDVVRVAVDGRTAGLVTAEIEFPKGPLGHRQPSEIVRPYGIQDVLPMIGPNALAAAGAIAVGQGGELTLGGSEDDQRLFRLELPS